MSDNVLVDAVINWIPTMNQTWLGIDAELATIGWAFLEQLQAEDVLGCLASVSLKKYAAGFHKIKLKQS